MKPDSLVAAVTTHIPDGGLPLLLVAILLLGYFAVIIYAISKASQFKGYAQDFPTQTGPVVVALVLALITAPVILTLIALRLDAPAGTGEWLAFIAVMAGVSGVGGLAVKRFSSPEYQQGKAVVEAAKAAATSPPVQMNVEGDARITAVKAVAPTPSQKADDGP